MAGWKVENNGERAVGGMRYGKRHLGFVLDQFGQGKIDKREV